jgi:hypothetical protein
VSEELSNDSKKVMLPILMKVNDQSQYFNTQAKGEGLDHHRRRGTATFFVYNDEIYNDFNKLAAEFDKRYNYNFTDLKNSSKGTLRMLCDIKEMFFKDYLINLV